MTFVALYTAAMAVALTMYGSTAIVGFTSLRGVYIAPCFSYPSASRFKVGIFGGAIIFFANLLLVCAVVFGEVRVRLVASNVLSYRPTLRNLTHSVPPFLSCTPFPFLFLVVFRRSKTGVRTIVTKRMGTMTTRGNRMRLNGLPLYWRSLACSCQHCTRSLLYCCFCIMAAVTIQENWMTMSMVW